MYQKIQEVKQVRKTLPVTKNEGTEQNKHEPESNMHYWSFIKNDMRSFYLHSYR